MGRFYGNHITPILTVPVVQLVCWIVGYSTRIYG